MRKSSTKISKLVEIYKNDSMLKLNDLLVKYRLFFQSSAYDNEVKAEILLIGNHQSRLNDVHLNESVVREVIRILASAKLWNKTYAAFDDILRDVNSTVVGSKNIGDLTRYDMALRLASINPSVNMPKYVHVYCGAEEGADNILGKDAVKKCKHKIPHTMFPPDVCSMQPFQIEDFLCVMHRALQSGTRPSPSSKKNKKVDAALGQPFLLNSSSNQVIIRYKHFRRNLLGHQIFDLGVNNASARAFSKFI